MLSVSYLGGGSFAPTFNFTETSPAQWLAALDAATLKSYLNRALVPKPTAKPVAFANVATPAQAQVYAQVAFHVSALAGWSKAAAVYFTVWNDVRAGVKSMTRLKSWLAFANQLADEARRGTTALPSPTRPPPALVRPTVTQGDGVSVTTEPDAPPIMPPAPQTAGASGRMWPWLLGGGAIVGIIAYAKRKKRAR